MKNQFWAALKTLSRRWLAPARENLHLVCVCVCVFLDFETTLLEGRVYCTVLYVRRPGADCDKLSRRLFAGRTDDVAASATIVTVEACNSRIIQILERFVGRI